MRTPSHTSAARPICAGALNACCNLRRSIPSACNSRAACGASRGSSQALSSKRCFAQFSLLEEIYGAKALDRMHLRAPAFIRYLGGNPYPRIVVTNRPSQREADWAYGPFASRAAAERFADEALKLFLLRRCTDDLESRSEPSGMRLLRDEDVPRTLLQGLHGRTLRRRGWRGAELSGHSRREQAGADCERSAKRPRPISNLNRLRRSMRRCRESKASALWLPNSCGP